MEIDSDVDNVDTAQLDLPKDSLRGGKTYLITSSVLIEKDDGLVKSQTTTTIKVDLKGLRARVSPTEAIIGSQSPLKLSGRLSQDFDNTDTPFSVSLPSLHFLINFRQMMNQY